LIVDGRGIPIAAYLEAADVHETRLVDPVLKSLFVEGQPERLGGDKSYDSDPLDAKLRRRGIEMIAEHRKNRKRPATQDGRVARRLKRRWKVERCNSWLKNYRRLLVRHEFYPENFLAFVHLACALILLRNLPQ
jgi:transposase